MKRSFFERLSGSASIDDNSFDSFDDDLPVINAPAPLTTDRRPNEPSAHQQMVGEDALKNEGQLPVDVHQTPSEIVVRTFVAGVRPDELSISISRDMVEIKGTRGEREQISSADYFSRELFWGSFSRTILLPQEVDVDGASASAKDGLLTITMPKLDKAKQTKLRVKAG